MAFEKVQLRKHALYRIQQSFQFRLLQVEPRTEHRSGHTRAEGAIYLWQKRSKDTRAAEDS
jgi:hypothetical protein